MHWRNFKTDEWETFERGEFPVDRAKEFIPQWDAAQALYYLHIKMGKEPLEAMGLVVEACVGKEPDGN